MAISSDTPHPFTWSEVAQRAYQAYAETTGNKNFYGETLTDWAELPEPIKTAWIAAVKAVYNIT